MRKVRKQNTYMCKGTHKDTQRSRSSFTNQLCELQMNDLMKGIMSIEFLHKY